jgi:branched-chain amino acid transport system substrate-binding protein
MAYRPFRLLFSCIALAACLSLGTLARPTAAQQAPLRIGVVFTFSGNGGPIGASFNNAVAAFQKKSGDTVAGRKVEILRRDDGGPAPDVARRLAIDLVSTEKVDMLAGLVFTPNAIAVGAVSTQTKKPLFITNAATSGILAKNPYAVRFSFTEAQLAVPLAKWALKNGIKTSYGIYLDYGPGIEANTAFSQAFSDGGGKMLGAVAVPITTLDYSPYLQRLRDAKPDAVFAFVGAQNGGVPFVRAFGQSGLGKAGMRVLATGDLTVEANFPGLGDGVAGVISASNYSAVLNTPVNREFERLYEQQSGGEVPDFFSVAAYDGMTAIYKIVAAQNGALDPDKTMELVKGMKLESPRGPIQIDPATRDVVQNVYILRTEKRRGKMQNTVIDTYPNVKDPFEQ